VAEAAPAEASGSTLWFDIHGRVTVAVAGSTPSVGRFRELLAPFRAGPAPTADLVVSATPRALDEPALIKWRYRYDSGAVEDLEEGWQVSVRDGAVAIAGRRDLLPVALPLLDWLLVRSGAALVHAGGVERAGHGICIPAAGGTGKTSVVAALARAPGTRFMGDDLLLVAEDRELLAFPKRIWLKSHHRTTYGQALRRERRVPLPYRFAQRRLVPLLQPFLARHPKARELGKRLLPVLPAVPSDPESALGVAVARAAPLRLVVLVERYEADAARIAAYDRGELASRLLGQFNADLLGDSQRAIAALASAGVLAWERHLERKADLLRKAIAGADCYRLRLPASWSRPVAAAEVASAVERLLG
jgi:hypothetical protein